MATQKYQKGKDGYYRTKVWDGTYNKDGTKHRINVKSAKSSRDLERQVEEIRRQVEERKITRTDDVLFVEYARQWFKTYKCATELNTRSMYDNVIEKKLTLLSGVKLQEISRLHFQQVLNANIDKPRTCEQIALTFRQVIKSAIADRLLPDAAYKDICDGISLAKYKSPTKRPLTALEKKAIKEADFTDRERCFVYLIYGLGLRREEALALCRTDISMKSRSVRIHSAVVFDKNNPVSKCPKSENGYRDVPMPDFLYTFLQEYIHGVDGYLIQKSRGGGVMTKSAYRKMWASIVRKVNMAAGGNEAVNLVPGLTAHVFRHNYCTQLCYQIPKISIKKIARLMGDTEKMVLSVYNHIIEEQEKAGEAVENAIGF